MARHSNSGAGNGSHSKPRRQQDDQPGRRANDSTSERSQGGSAPGYRGQADRETGENPPYSGGRRFDRDLDRDDDDREEYRAFGTHEAGEDRDNYNASADHLHDPAPQSYQGVGFFSDAPPFERSEKHVGMGHAVGYGPQPNPSRGLGFRGRGPKGYQRSDDRLLEEINERLTHDDDIDAHEISVSVEKGEVTLSGTVNSRDEKRRADDIAEDVSGVQHVQNNLRVKRQETQEKK
jgi:osmotically-inducible protein OsmY